MLGNMILGPVYKFDSLCFFPQAKARFLKATLVFATISFGGYEGNAKEAQEASTQRFVRWYWRIRMGRR